MNEYEENGRELERTIVELQKDVGSMSPRRMLEIVRNRMDADYPRRMGQHSRVEA